ncbi:c-type cytochrome [Achromobacter sp. ESBL13]|uniref:c-type cytochrome n=1 Tax=Achromobacter sp. ESBL13 TaxID=3077328 RepID=UPI002FCBACA2
MLALISIRSVSLPRFRAIFRVLAAAAVVFTTSVAQAQPAAPDTLRPDTMAARVAACTACHGAQGRAGTDGYYPRLAGKPQDYLYHQLLNFRDERRQYRPMSHLLVGLPDDYLREMAQYFSQQHVPYPPPIRADVSSATLEAGRVLALQGDAARGLPACASCHGAALGGLMPAIPGLLGLPRDYIGSQIGSWKNGLRRAAAPDCMADIAQKLTPTDIGALAAWLSSQPVIEPYVPDAAASLTLPAQCGSQAQR